MASFLAPPLAVDGTTIQNVAGVVSVIGRYAATSTAARPAIGAIIAEGYLATSSGLGGNPTFGASSIGVRALPTSPVHNLPFNLVNLGSVGQPNGLGRGLKLSIKGFYIARADAPLDATCERFGIYLIGASFSSGVGNACASETETTRDDNPGVGAVVDDAEHIKTYDCAAAAGDASYTDTGFTADLSAGIPFEVIISAPSTTDAPNDLAVSITIDGKVAFAAAAPSMTAVSPFLNIMYNQDGELSQLVYKLERVA